MSIAEQPETVDVTVDPQTQPLAAGLIRNAALRHLERGEHEPLRWLCAHPAAPDDFLLEMCDRGICLDELAHRSGPRSLLEKLANQHDYPEAIITLGIDLFVDPQASREEFAAFLSRHGKQTWLFESLIQRAGDDSSKQAAFHAAIQGHPDAARLIDLMQLREQERQALIESDPHVLERHYESLEPRVWHSLAQNRAAPRTLLEKLATASGVPLAREIRTRAAENLRERGWPRHGHH